MEEQSSEIIYPEVDTNTNTNIEQNKDITMDASVNCYADRRGDECLDVGLEAIASSHRAGLAAEASSQRGFNHADGTAQRMAIAELDATNRVGSDVCDSSRDIMRDIHAADNHVSGSVERHSLFNAGVTERNADKTQAEVERFGLSELESIRDSERYLFAGMSQNAKETLLEFERTKLLINANAKDALLQACGNAKDAALAARDLMHQADKNTAAIQLEAFRHKEELARQIAECCCEQKALTLETSHRTQDVIREVEDRRVRDELARTREELIALRVRSTLLPTLTGTVPL